MKQICVILSVFFALTSCHPKVKTLDHRSENSSACIKKAIENFSKTDCDKNPNVKEYTFQGKKVYVFDPGTCGADITSEVLDEACKSLGFLGGFIGNTKINGESFDNAVLVKTMWEK